MKVLQSWEFPAPPRGASGPDRDKHYAFLRQRLQNLIQIHFAGNNSAFLEAFAAAGGGQEHGNLNHQLNGNRAISQGYASAYALFFRPLEEKRARKTKKARPVAATQ